jgi:hypothetical protein
MSLQESKDKLQNVQMVRCTTGSGQEREQCMERAYYIGMMGVLWKVRGGMDYFLGMGG